MRHFWQGFYKRATSETGGQGHTGTGKGVLHGQLEVHEHDSTQEAYGRADGEDTRATHELRDVMRGPRNFNPFDHGEVLRDESTPILY